MINNLSLAELIEPLEGSLSGTSVIFSAVSTDTRTLSGGELYVALRGEAFDGNEFVGEAQARGACAAIVSAEVVADIPLLRVADTTAALGQLGRLNRQLSQAKVLALTGSQGKTTVKEMTGAILEQNAQILLTRGNYNNAIGVPLTLMNLTKQHEFAVLELGANAPGEIAYSVSLVRPEVVLITNAAETHLEGFGDLDGVVRTKGEIIDGVAAAGTVILNADDPAFNEWKARAGNKRTVAFSLRADADHAQYRAAEIELAAEGSRFTLVTPLGSARISLPFPGGHNIANALAAAALSMEAGANLESVVTGLDGAKPPRGRLNVLRGRGGSILIDDSYNASPSSFRAAIDVLAEFSGYRIVVIGDMGELGPAAEQAHRDVGKYAAKHGIDGVWSVGPLSEQASRVFGPGGEHFATRAELVENCLARMDANTAILIKGSRSAGMDVVVSELKSEDN
ncbi:MAG: UDP-N-acetylmuramoyl-tripeptide--D-alanyl-D-alanine ligase [Pseudohongiellaceae bacterium]